ncbi:MAG: hypothetical protein ACRDDH_11790 [Cetobacterium sp.]|uniref:hypothetical protein n=1 Tax=Cetobacterium sp. TaxID=2071632 RepID=UPI003EE72D9B
MATKTYLYKDLHTMATGAYSVYELATMFGVSEREIENAMKQYDIPTQIGRYTHWTKKEDKRLIEMRKSGFTNKEIAKELRRSLSMINSRIGNMKLPKKQKNRRWTEDDYHKIFLLKASGMTFREIGDVLDINFNTIAGRYYRRKREVNE